MDFDSEIKLKKLDAGSFSNAFSKKEEESHVKKMEEYFKQDDDTIKNNILKPIQTTTEPIKIKSSTSFLKNTSKTTSKIRTNSKSNPTQNLLGSSSLSKNNDLRGSYTMGRGSLLNKSENNKYQFPAPKDRNSLVRTDKTSIIRTSQHQPFNFPSGNYRKKSSGQGLEIRASHNHTTAAMTATHGTYNHNILAKHGGRKFR